MKPIRNRSMTRFDRHSRISPHERYRALERRAWGSLALSLSLLAALGFFGMRSPLHQQGKSGAPQLHGFWAKVPWITPPAPLRQDMATRHLPSPPLPPLQLPPLPPQPQPQPQPSAPAPDIGAPCLSPPTALLPLPSPFFRNTPDSGSPKPISPKAPPRPSPASSPPPAPPANGATGNFIPPAYHTAPKPPYPPTLRQQRAESSLRVRISINSDGIPTDVSIISSSGYSEFDNSTRRWILDHWRFTPARRAGIPTAATVTTTVSFVLE